MTNFWKQSDKLHVQIDMIDQKGRMWNENDKEKKNLFEVALPESAAIFVDVGLGKLEMIAIHQECRYTK